MGLFTSASSINGYPALDALPWHSRPDEAVAEARALLNTDGISGELVAWLAERPPEELQHVLERSLERTTHFKWFLGGRWDHYVVWLHEYKPPAVFDQATAFAASVHDHRYGFCSRVLRGGLLVSTFTPPPPDGDSASFAGRHRVDLGETMLLSPDDIHRIDQVAPDTCTLLVQGPTARNFSTCYDAGGGSGRRVYDMQSRLPRTLTLLAGDRADVSVG